MPTAPTSPSTPTLEPIPKVCLVCKVGLLLYAGICCGQRTLCKKCAMAQATGGKKLLSLFYLSSFFLSFFLSFFPSFFLSSLLISFSISFLLSFSVFRPLSLISLPTSVHLPLPPSHNLSPFSIISGKCRECGEWFGQLIKLD